MIPDLMAGEFDAIFSGMSITAKREELIDFTEAYYPPTPSVYVAKAGAGDEAVEGTIGAAPNTIYSDYFAELDRPVVLLDDSSTTLNSINAVLAGTVGRRPRGPRLRRRVALGARGPAGDRRPVGAAGQGPRNRCPQGRAN